ncbi:MAG: ABC transporter ATP-binding protein [Magnetococcales bacterium]|nr:ABC transporter ATP-binding protein [Magnetococcales bacterium]MBF0148928.1 ABC transporter ATP-binding protein [Magnetococcales bacterium]MBF0629702.1 ABC transporter ATP-binding protein [Magnetococcales bacterium]
MDVLRFEGVRKRFAAHEVLQGLEFTVRQGEFFAFVGANGQGKTTLIKGLLDFIRIDGGNIFIHGKDHRETRARSGLAYLPERFTPPWFLKGGEFLRYVTRLHQQPFVADQVDEILADLDLEPAALKRHVRDFSKGMTQKLGLAGAFLSGRDLLVLDEPMSGLDPKARVMLKRRLLKFKEEGRTLFFSTHLLADVEELCDRMAILHSGHLRFEGSPADCRKDYPGNTLEESFIRCIDGFPSG